MKPHCFRSLATSTLLAALSIASSPALTPASADVIAEDPVWIAFDGRAAPSPPSIVVEAPDRDNTDLTAYDIVLEGFYIQRVWVDGVEYHRLFLLSPDLAGIDGYVFDPDDPLKLPTTDTVGRPELPMDAGLLGIPHEIDPQTGVAVQAVLELAFECPCFDGFDCVGCDQPNAVPLRVYPVQPDTKDCDCCAEPPPFQVDQGFYGGQDWLGPYPAALAQADAIESLMTIDSARVRTHLMRFDPGAGTLTVARKTKVTVLHPFFQQLDPLPRITAELQKFYQSTIRNFGRIKHALVNAFQSSYLILVHKDFAAAIEPLRQAKVDAGHNVTLTKVAAAPGPGEVAATRPAIRTAIKNFYDNATLLGDVHVLLVGDAAHIPPDSFTQSDGESGPADKPYADVRRADGRADLVIGRISADDAGSLADMVIKTLRYEKTPPGGGWYKELELVASKNAPHKYINSVLASWLLATWPGAVNPPNVTLRWGKAPNPDSNTDVENDFNAGRGVGFYRGHGCLDSWAGWRDTPVAAASHWDNLNVGFCSLQNKCMTPVLFAIACFTNRFTEQAANPGAPPAWTVPCKVLGAPTDCLGERWLEVGATKGAVTHYGSTQGSPTVANDDLHATLVNLLYRKGLTHLGYLTLAAERRNVVQHPVTGLDNHSIYQILGDPDLRIRTAPPAVPGKVRCEGDINGDGMVDGADLGLLNAAWGPVAPCDPAIDLDGDGDVDGADLGMLLAAWGPC